MKEGNHKELFVSLYSSRFRIIRNFILKVVRIIEKGELYSPTLRAIFAKYYKVDIGLYSHGGCFIPRHIDRFTKIGRFCTIAETARSMNRNHPLDYCSTHAFFFNPKLKVVDKDTVKYVPLEIGHDVWIGDNAIIMPSVSSIGTGAVISAGAVVNKDVPPYAIMIGNPAKISRYRFSSDTIDRLLKIQWWNNSLAQLNIEDMTRPLESEWEE